MLDKRDIKKLILLFAAGVSAGFLNGFLGAGGGIILMWLFNRQCGGEGADNVRDSFASVVAIVLMISTVSAVSYSRSGSLDVASLLPLLIPAVVGGVAGAYLTDRLDTRVLRFVFGIVLVVAGANMVW